MQLWRIFFLICLVNLSTLAVASDSGTSIRGPRATDQQSRVQQLGPITPTDTLWRLAQQVQPEGADMYQVMYAIYLKNPQAFLDNNFNHLRTGAMLDVPNSREIRAADPVLARQKSTADDESWARRARASRPAPTETAQPAVNQQLQQTVERLEQEQQQQLQQLRHRFGESMLLVEGIMQENQGLKNTLDSVQQQLDALKEQMVQDAELQRELEQMVRLQAEWMAEQQAMREAAATPSGWQQLAASPAFWMLAASVPALGILLGLLFWIKRRSKRAQETIHAATSEPKATENYQSPLPEVDDNLDVDDSLFSLDDSLLDDAFNDDVDDSPVNLSDDLLDDEVLLDDSSIGGSDDLLDTDDALLDDEALLDDDALLDEELLSEPETATAQSESSSSVDETDADFDPDNILSGTDLDSLFAEADDDIEQGQASPDDFDDELLEEIELDIPDDEVDDTASTAAAEADFSEPAELEELNEQEEQPVRHEPESDDLIIDEPTAEAIEPEPQFDSSELDAFAESLVEESLEQDTVPQSDDAFALLEDEPDDVQQQEQQDALTVQLDTELQDAEPQDRLEDALVDDELSMLLNDDPEVQMQPDDSPDTAGHAEPPMAESSEPDNETLEREAATEAEYLTDYADLEDDFPAETSDDSTTDAPNLSDQDDDSVSPLSAAARSVENPSEVLEEYPELELTDDDVSDTAEFAASEPATAEAEDAAFDDALLQEQDDVALSELAEDTELDDDDATDFDALLSELEQMAERVAEQDADASEVLKDPSATESAVVADDDFQDIDQLLAEANERVESAQPADLTMDLDLDDYQQVLEHAELADEHGEYAAQLDLIRAYLEIDDQDSAEQVIKELLNSDAPVAVKDEVTQLQQAKQQRSS